MSSLIDPSPNFPGRLLVKWAASSFHGEATSFPKRLSGFRCITTRDEIAVESERIRACLALGGGLREYAGGYRSRRGVTEGIFCVVRIQVDNKHMVQLSGDRGENKEIDS